MGSLLGLCLIIQIITGVTLAMHYVSNIDYAFTSVEHIMREVNNGWLIRYLHANGAGFFFIIVYIHIGKGLYYGSYQKPRELTWSIGVIIFLIMIITAFLGYTLPWGQMSYWAAVVITNLLSAIPWIGNEIVQFIWGNFSVENATLNRFYSLHYLLPFVLSGLVGAHILTLHVDGSGNPLGITSLTDKIPFYPYFTFKDLYGFMVFFFIYFIFVFYYPNLLGHEDNYIEANALVTPSHISPEFYFLPFYAILRAIPSKLGGVLAMGLSILILLLLPILDGSHVRSNGLKPISKLLYWIFIINFILLAWLGGNAAEEPYVTLSRICTLYYFIHILILIPIISRIENKLLGIKEI